MRLLLGCALACLWAAVSPPASAGYVDPCGGYGADSDCDTVIDALDNCLSKANAGALFCDSDNDGYGNACDTDYNQTFTTNVIDFGIFKQNFGQPGETDHNCNGTTNLLDFGVFKQNYGLPPGPSGLSCAGTTPCN